MRIPDSIVQKLDELMDNAEVLDWLRRNIEEPPENADALALSEITGVDWFKYYGSGQGVADMYDEFIDLYCRQTSHSVVTDAAVVKERLRARSRQIHFEQEDDGELFS